MCMCQNFSLGMLNVAGKMKKARGVYLSEQEMRVKCKYPFNVLHLLQWDITTISYITDFSLVLSASPVGIRAPRRYRFRVALLTPVS